MAIEPVPLYGVYVQRKRYYSSSKDPECVAFEFFLFVNILFSVIDLISSLFCMLFVMFQLLIYGFMQPLPMNSPPVR